MFDLNTKEILIECLNKNIRLELQEASSPSGSSSPPYGGPPGVCGATPPRASTISSGSTPDFKGGGFGSQDDLKAQTPAQKSKVLNPLDTAFGNLSGAERAEALGMAAGGAIGGSITGLGNKVSGMIGGKFLGPLAGMGIQKLQKGLSDLAGGKRAMNMLGDIPTTSSNILVTNLGYTPAGSWAAQKFNEPEKPEPVKSAKQLADEELDKKIADEKRRRQAAALGITP